MFDERTIAIPLFIDVNDVMGSMKCSRSRAYEHMRAALGRKRGERGQSRVPLYVWDRYVRARFDPEARQENAGAPALRSLVRVTRATTRPRVQQEIGSAAKSPCLPRSARVLERS